MCVCVCVFSPGAIWQCGWPRQSHPVSKGDGRVPTALPRGLWEVQDSASQVSRTHIVTFIWFSIVIFLDRWISISAYIIKVAYIAMIKWTQSPFPISSPFLEGVCSTALRGRGRPWLHGLSPTSAARETGRFLSSWGKEPTASASGSGSQNASCACSLTRWVSWWGLEAVCFDTILVIVVWDELICEQKTFNLLLQ